MAAVNSKAQAAVTDALFLLLIVGVLSTSLVIFSIGYGKTVQKYLSDQYLIDFETTALKTILYSSVPRDFNLEENPNPTLYNSRQVDYLLAVVKEDYLDDAALSDRTKDILRNTSKIATKPLASSFDYMFLIQTMESPTKFVFIYLNTSNNDGRGRVEYYCTAKDFQNVQSFLESAGTINPVVSGIKLSKVNFSTAEKDAEPVSAIAVFAMWVGTFIDTEKVKTMRVTNQELSQISFTDPASIGCNSSDGASCPGILVCKLVEGSASIPAS